ncbi:MAG: hypothetical protein JSR46_10525 [Verrucomicrobia bacterium]|nr:hypothetical protein [Verrucomicrobiota bacterium]
MSISLLGSLLPPLWAPERRTFDERTEILQGASTRVTQNVQLGQLFLEIGKEGLCAAIEGRYKDLDALVKNFGCQITALQVKRILDMPQSTEKAEESKKAIEGKLALCEALRKKGNAVEIGKNDYENLALFLQKVDIDLEVPVEIAQLVRFRLLCIINDNQDKNGVEVPFTNMKLMAEKIKGLRLNKIDPQLVGALVSGVQAEESRKALIFIRQEAIHLSDEITPRALLIQRLLSSSFERKTATSKKHSSIVSVSLLYNAEAVLRRLQGVVLLKQKTTFCGKANDRLPMKLFLKMPEERVLEPNELALLPKKETILVVEGYINVLDLAEQVARLGLFTILNSNAACIDQYAQGSDQSPIEDEEAASDIAFYASRKDEIVEDIFKIDHVYCASVQEEEG